MLADNLRAFSYRPNFFKARLSMKIIIPIICLLIGLAVGAKFFSTTETAKEISLLPQSKTQKKLESFNKAAQKISNIDLLEYIKLKTMKEKYEKADEILGKIMLLFLANVQLEMNKDVKEYFSTSKRPTLKNDIPKSISVSKKKESIEVIISPFKKFNKKNLGKIENEDFSDIEIKTAKFELKEPYSFYKNAKSATELKEVFRVYGKFEGELYRTTGKTKGSIDKVLLEIKFMQVGDKLKGEYFSELRRDGVAYSTNRGSGYNGQVKLIKKPKKHLLLQMSPNSFLQVFPSNESEVIIGRFYDNDEYAGLVRVEKL